MRINTGCFLDGCRRFDPDDEEGVEIKCDREWKTLTDTEIDAIAVSGDHEILTFARAIEAKLKEKNT
jgi:hypothetical protein